MRTLTLTHAGSWCVVQVTWRSSKDLFSCYRLTCRSVFIVRKAFIVDRYRPKCFLVAAEQILLDSFMYRKHYIFKSFELTLTRTVRTSNLSVRYKTVYCLMASLSKDFDYIPTLELLMYNSEQSIPMLWQIPLTLQQKWIKKLEISRNTHCLNNTFLLKKFQ